MESAIDLGDLPSWLSAITSIMTLIFAALAAVAAYRVYRIESERDRVDAEMRQHQDRLIRSKQAALVSAWWGEYTADPDSQDRPLGAFVRNASDTPVYDAIFTVVNIHRPDATQWFEIPVVPPVSDPIFRPTPLDEDSAARSARSLSDHRVEVTFTDSAGIRWIRDKDGRLDEVQPEVTIWGDERRTEMLSGTAQGFLVSHGVRTAFKVHRWSSLTAEMAAATEPQHTPDILLGPHDWIGYLVQEQVIEPWSISPHHRTSFVQRALEAVTYEGQLYGLPYTMDSPILIRNTDLAPEPPTSFEELITSGERLRKTGRAEQIMAVPVGPDGEPFYMYPLLLAAGGRVLGNGANGGIDPSIVNLSLPESVAALEQFRRLGEKGLGVLHRGIGEQQAVDLFLSHRTPYLICCCWALGEIRRSGVPYAITPIPAFAGHSPVRPLVSVESFLLIRHGKNKTIARDWVTHHLTRTDVTLALLQEQPRPPARQYADYDFIGRDPDIRSVHQIWLDGDLMPSTPQMIRLWPALAAVELQLISGVAPTTVLRRLGQVLHDSV